MIANETQAYILDQHTAPGTLWHPEGDAIRCVACGHRCLIGEGVKEQVIADLLGVSVDHVQAMLEGPT